MGDFKKRAPPRQPKIKFVFDRDRENLVLRERKKLQDPAYFSEVIETDDPAYTIGRMQPAKPFAPLEDLSTFPLFQDYARRF